MRPQEKWWKGGPAREMTRCDGWVMARRPGSIPFTVYAKDWDALPSAEDGERDFLQYKAVLERGPHK